MLLPLLLLAWPPESNATLAPIGKWQVDYDTEQCVASRQFGSQREPVTLMIKPTPTSDIVQLLLLADGFESQARQFDAVITIGKAAPVKVHQLNYGLKIRTRLVNLSGYQAEPLNHSDKIVWEARGANVVLETGSMERVMKTLDDCRKKLRDFWNISPERAPLVKQWPVPAVPIISLFSSGDYPAQAMREGDTGMTSIVALVDEKGGVRECMIDQTSGYATLDAKTCMVIRNRSQFAPAIDQNGKPIRAVYGQRVRWELPRNVPLPVDRRRRKDKSAEKGIQ